MFLSPKFKLFLFNVRGGERREKPQWINNVPGLITMAHNRVAKKFRLPVDSVWGKERNNKLIKFPADFPNDTAYRYHVTSQIEIEMILN